MYETILIKSVLVVSSSTKTVTDIFIKDGKINDVGVNLSCKAEHIINGSNLALFPGIIDTHVHFREPGLTHKEDIRSGSMAAAAGGVTSFFDMPNTNPPTTTFDALNFKKAIAAKNSLVNYNFFVGATKDNLTNLNEFNNIAGIKLFMGSSTGNLLLCSPKELNYLFKNTKHLIAVHAEDENIIKKNLSLLESSKDVLCHEKIRSEEAALKAVKTAVQLAVENRVKTHILHVTSKIETEYLKKYKESPYVSCEVTPQHILLSSPQVYQNFGTFAQVNPPIRTKSDSNALFQGLKDGTINTIATDHAPHLYEEKEKGFPLAPSGMPGVETALPLMLNLVDQKKCTLMDIVKWMCEEPANIFNIKNKGYIKRGYDADLVLIDLHKTKVLENKNLITKAKWSIFNQSNITGWPIMTIVGGNIVYNEGDFFTEVSGKEIIFNDYDN